MIISIKLVVKTFILSFLLLAASNLSVFAQYYEHFYFTVPITSELYTSKEEVLNISYREYLYYVKQDSSKDFYLSQLPNDDSDSLFNRKNYLENDETRFYPMVNLEYEQARNFCRWLDNIYHINSMEKENYIDTSQFNFEVRLPTIEEWALMALKYDYDLKATQELDEIKKIRLKSYSEFRDLAKKQGLSGSQIRKNWKEFNQFMLANKIYAFENLKYQGENQLFDTLISNDFPWGRNIRNPLNVPLDLRGNVSEMTQTKGIAKGGNWNTKAYEIGVYDYVKYSEPSNTIGFRCVCEIKKK